MYVYIIVPNINVNFTIPGYYYLFGSFTIFCTIKSWIEYAVKRVPAKTIGLPVYGTYRGPEGADIWAHKRKIK